MNYKFYMLFFYLDTGNCYSRPVAKGPVQYDDENKRFWEMKIFYMGPSHLSSFLKTTLGGESRQKERQHDSYTFP